MRTSLSLQSCSAALVLCSALLSVFAHLPAVAADAAQQAATPSVEPAYVDQLIDPALLDDEYADGWQADETDVQGRRFFSIEYQHYQERYGSGNFDDTGDLDEDGVQFKWRRETLDYGEFHLDASGYRGNNESLRFDNSGGGRFTLNQFGFVLDENRVMDNTLGVLRSATDPMVTSSFRLNLSSTLLAGGQTRVSRDGLSTVYATAGRIGRLDPSQLQGFHLEDGAQYGLGYSREFAANWRAGAQLVSVQGSSNTPDHESVASAVQYQSPDERERYVGHVLIDSEGQYGVWADGDNRVHRWRHRYGLFRMDPDLLWSDNQPNNDQQGGYLRSELTTLRYNFTAGLDLTQTNIDNRADRAGNNLYNGFVNGSWRMNRTTSFGGTLTLRGKDARDDFTEDDARNVILTGFVSHAYPIGTTRLQVLASRIEEVGDNGNGYGVIWDQNWNATRNLLFSSTLSYATESGLDDSEDRSSASLLFRHDVTTTLQWNGDISYIHIDRNRNGSQNSTNASVAAAWRFLRNWDASLRLTYNSIDNVLGNIDGGFSGNEKTVLLNIRYSKSRGQPFALMGADGGAAGYGAVTGMVFFDDNGDGVRQAGERAATGVFVYLDRRYQTVTDQDGLYVFEPVPVGKHDVTLAQEDLPLPWGLLDESPRNVSVSVRVTTGQDFGLRRLNE
jgi:hypothetical protein